MRNLSKYNCKLLLNSSFEFANIESDLSFAYRFKFYDHCY